MGTANYLEAYLVTVFPFQSAGIAMAQINLLEKTTIQKRKGKQTAINGFVITEANA